MLCHNVRPTSDMMGNWKRVFRLTVSAHVREGYSNHFVSHFFISEKAPFSGSKLTAVQSR